MTKVLENMKTEKDRGPDYTNPAWAYERAHYNGYIEALDQVLKLLPTEKK